MRTDGTLWCWGNDQTGELGQGAVDKLPHSTPARSPRSGWGDNLNGESGHTPGQSGDIEAGALWLNPTPTPIPLGP